MTDENLESNQTDGEHKNDAPKNPVDLEIQLFCIASHIPALSRTVTDIEAATNELSSLIWRYDEDRLPKNRGTYAKDLTVRTKTMGTLRPGDLTEYQWGQIHGRLEAMEWAMGAYWDNNWHDVLDCARRYAEIGFVPTEEELRMLVGCYARIYHERYYSSFLSSCYGGEWRHRAYGNARMDLIAKVIGDDAVQDEFTKGVEEFIAEQNPVLWRMYQEGIEPARCSCGEVLDPPRPAVFGHEHGPCKCLIVLGSEADPSETDPSETDPSLDVEF